MKVTWENESLPIFDQRSKTSNYCKKRQIPKYTEIQDSIPKITEIVLGGINIYRILRLARGQTPKDDGIFSNFYTFFFQQNAWIPFRRDGNFHFNYNIHTETTTRFLGKKIGLKFLDIQWLTNKINFLVLFCFKNRRKRHPLNIILYIPSRNKLLKQNNFAAYRLQITLTNAL